MDTTETDEYQGVMQASTRQLLHAIWEGEDRREAENHIEWAYQQYLASPDAQYAQEESKMRKFNIANALHTLADKVDEGIDKDAIKAKAGEAKAKALEGYDRAIIKTTDATHTGTVATKRVVNNATQAVADRTKGEITTF